MPLKVSLPWLLSILGVMAVALFVVIAILPQQDRTNGNRPDEYPTVKLPSTGPGDVVSLDAKDSDNSSRGLPTLLKIPKIGVDAVFEYVGFTADGAMDMPKTPEGVAWLKLGPRPGEIGSAVIAGHYGWKNNTPAVFDKLSTLRKGDKLSVEDDRGAVVSFVVREIRTYGEHENASAVFGVNDEKAHLNLVTCKGTWDKAQKSYSDRLVVFTDKEE